MAWYSRFASGVRFNASSASVGKEEARCHDGRPDLPERADRSSLEEIDGVAVLHDRNQATQPVSEGSLMKTVFVLGLSLIGIGMGTLFYLVSPGRLFVNAVSGSPSFSLTIVLIGGLALASGIALCLVETWMTRRAN